MWTHVMQTTRRRIQFLLTEDKYFLSICRKRNPHLVQFPADQAWSVSWCGWRSVYNVETKSGRGLARQIGKPILPIRSHQNPRSEYDHLSPMVVGHVSPAEKRLCHKRTWSYFYWVLGDRVYVNNTDKNTLQDTEDCVGFYDKDWMSGCQIWAAIMIKIAIVNPDGT